jgi:metal transporter CNNM
MIYVVTWVGILACLSQSALLSGLNLAFFSIGRLRLEAAASAGDAAAQRVLSLRRNANLVLATILWGNVAVNVLLTLLANSVLAGASAFLFSTVVITLLGEILPQSYFARHALRLASRLTPLLRFYQAVLYPLARPTGWLLDRFFGPEGIPWFREHELRAVLRHQASSGQTELDALEATGAANFLALDDVPVGEEGEVLDPRSVIRVHIIDDRPSFPEFRREPDDPFLRRLEASGKKWAVLVDDAGDPRFVLNIHYFLRDALFKKPGFDPGIFCHRPLVIRDPRTPLGSVLSRLTVHPQNPADDVIDRDIILVWSEQRRIITGSDLLGRLLRGIARRTPL